MLLGIAGITGAGKSYYKTLLARELDFHAVPIITTRPPRSTEQAGIDKIFVTPSELETLKSQGQIAYSFEMLDYFYAYPKSIFEQTGNFVFEIAYYAMPELKRLYPQVSSLYLRPSSIELAKSHLDERGYNPARKARRLAEVDAHLKAMEDPQLQAVFDTFMTNDYTPNSDAKILQHIKTLLEKELSL